MAKAALNIPVKEQAVKLLYENVPPNGGWKNRTKAAEAIAAELWEFIEQQNKIEKRITLDPDNLVITLKQWASKDKDDQLLEAFNKTVRTKKKNEAPETLHLCVITLLIAKILNVDSHFLR